MPSEPDAPEAGSPHAPWLGKWENFIDIIDAALNQHGKDESGQATFDEKERKHYESLREQIRRNRSAYWTNVHRSIPLWKGYGVNMTLHLSPAVRDKGWHTPAKQKALRDGLAAELTGLPGGFVLRAHSTVYDADDGLIPFHFHCWALPFRFTSAHIRLLKEKPKAALRRFAREGEDMPGAGGPLSRWLASRHIGEGAWTVLMIRFGQFWRAIQERVFGVKLPASASRLVSIRQDAKRAVMRRAVRMTPNDLNPLRRNTEDLTNLTTYIQHGPSPSERMQPELDRETGMVEVDFRYNGNGTYTPLAFCRRFLPPKSEARGMPYGMLRGRHPAMRVFEGAFGEMVETDNGLLHWATLSPAVIRRRLTPDSARRLRAKAEETRAVMECPPSTAERESKPATRKTIRRLSIWDEQHRYFSGEYVLVLYYMQYLAEAAEREPTPRKTAKEPPPTYLLRRHPLQSIKRHAENDGDFLANWYDAHQPDHAKELLRIACLREAGEPIGKGRKRFARRRNPSSDV